MGATILIVDDSPDTVEILATWLQGAGYQTTGVYSGQEALLAAQKQPDLILLDVTMPGMDGIETCRRLCANPTTAEIPVILVSAKNPAEARAEGLLAGAVDYITKPVNLPDLSERVTAALESKAADHLNAARLLQEVLHSALAVLPCELAWLLELNPEEDTLQSRTLVTAQGEDAPERFANALGGTPQELSFSLDEKDNFVAGVLVSRRARLNIPVAELNQHPGARRFYQAFRTVEVNYASLMPLTLGSRAVGVLLLGTVERPDLESTRGWQILTALASQAATAVDYARLAQNLAEQEVLMRAEQTFRQMLLDTMGDGLMVIGAKGEIDYANNRLLRMSGYTREELYGKCVDFLFHPDDREQLKIDLIQKRGTTMKFDQRLYTRSGIEIPVLMSRSSFSSIDSSATEQVLVVSDLTEQKRREVALQRQSQRLQGLNQAAQAISSSLSAHDVINRILNAAMTVVDAENASIMLRSVENPDELVFIAAVGPNSEVMPGMRVPLGQGVAGWVAREAKSQLVADAAQDERFYRDIDQSTGLATRSIVAVPMMVADKVVGVLEAVNKRGGTFDQEDVDLMEGVAGTAAIAIENARLFNQTRRRLVELGTLLDASAAVSSTLDFGSVLEVIVRRLADALQVERCLVFSWDRTADMLEPLAEVVHAYWPPGKGPINSLSQVPLRRAALNSGLPVLAHVHDSRTDPTDRAELEAMGQLAMLIAPLWVGKRVAGLLILYSSLAGHFFSEEHVSRVEATIQAWQDGLGRALGEKWRTETPLSDLCNELLAIPGVTWAAVEEWQQDQNRTCRLCEYGFAVWTEQRGNRRSLNDYPVVRRVLTIAQPKVINLKSLDSDPNERQFLERMGGQVCLMAPLIIHGEPTGVVKLVDMDSRRTFDNEEISLCQGIANVVSNAMENSHLYQTLERRASALEAAYAEVQQADQVKDELIQNLSHELQTPLLHILGYVELMIEGSFGPLNDEQRDRLQFVMQRAQDLASLVKDIMSVQALQNEKLQAAPTDLGGVVRNALNRWRHEASTHGIVLASRVAPDLPLAMADAGRMAEAIDHLIDNAIKFSPHGGRVDIEIVTQQAVLNVRVRDQGIGIPPEVQEHIFKRFYQVDGSSTRNYSGTGLGLSIVREIVTQHGGQIWVESEVGQGSTFSFTIPRADMFVQTGVSSGVGRIA